VSVQLHAPASLRPGKEFPVSTGYETGWARSRSGRSEKEKKNPIILPAGKSLDNSVRIAIGYGLDDRMMRVRFPAGAGNFSLQHHVQTGSGTHTASYPMGAGAVSLGVRRPGREADHSPAPGAKVKECVELYLQSPNMSSWRGA
jgi:hypothetical protein